jgi:putative iron-only hydrogenase system regulator
MTKENNSKVAVISIIIHDFEKSGEVNAILHEFRNYIVGRMGLPYRERGVSIISVVIDAPGELTSALSGKLGMLESVTAKTLTAKL